MLQGGCRPAERLAVALAHDGGAVARHRASQAVSVGSIRIEKPQRAEGLCSDGKWNHHADRKHHECDLRMSHVTPSVTRAR